MATYLLTWNPKRWEWTDIGESIDEIKDVGYSDTSWSSGVTKRIAPGDRVFIIRLGKKPRGIFASGWATSHVYEDEHWDENYHEAGRKALYIGTRLDVIINPYVEPVLARAKLNEGILGHMGWDAQASGVSIPEDVAAELESAWREFCTINGKTQQFASFVSASSAEELAASDAYFEGAVERVTVNVYERNAEARQRCIGHYGFKCNVCGFDFQKTYGSVGAEYIHMHHLIPLSDIGKEYELDPVEDLRPVCPNCHAIIHRKRPPYTLEEVRSFLEEASS